MLILPRSGALALLLVTVCSACGGGGGGGAGDGVRAAPPPTVLVRWQESPGAAGYRVHWGTAPSIYTHTVDAGSPDVGADRAVATIVELEGDADAYYLAVTAHGRDGQSSAFSNEVVLHAR